MLDEQTVFTLAAWLSLQDSFKLDNRKVLMVLTMKTKCEPHTLCGNLTYSYAKQIECLPSFRVGCLHRWRDTSISVISNAQLHRCVGTQQQQLWLMHWKCPTLTVPQCCLLSLTTTWVRLPLTIACASSAERLIQILSAALLSASKAKHVHTCVLEWFE